MPPLMFRIHFIHGRIQRKSMRNQSSNCSFFYSKLAISKSPSPLLLLVTLFERPRPPLSHSKGKTYEMRVPKSTVVCVALLLLLATAQESCPYSDPVSRSLSCQMPAAGCVCVAFL